nr:MAG TPA: hypothetical protein [Caudoviricetes sp.]
MIIYQVVSNGDIVLETRSQDRALQKIKILIDEGKHAELKWYFV